jgi:aminomethyltransferase
MNNHILRGGHLSAQPMGALRDFVARDPVTERFAVVNFPVMKDNPYRIDTDSCADLIEKYRPALAILGKSMIIHREPVAELRRLIDDLGTDTILMYDMAHVLGLVGPHFQLPFEEGADMVTGSTHKTYFGTQRGVIAMDLDENDPHERLWTAVQRRVFPGSVSNHHLGTMLGLLMAAYEMNHFKDEYQQKVIENAKSFARSLKNQGLEVAGDESVSYTETHQVIVQVGYGKGPEVAQKLEDNNIIVNYQATPDDEGFGVSSALRLGTAEMTRFGMEEIDFDELAGIMGEVIHNNADVKAEVAAMRKRFLEMRFCFEGPRFEGIVEELSRLL